jgi:hypothetical protein
VIFAKGTNGMEWNVDKTIFSGIQKEDEYSEYSCRR